MQTKDILKTLRKQKGFSTMQDFCSAANISFSTYQNYESGKRLPTAEFLIQLADFYGVTTDYLLGREPPSDPLATLGLTIHEISDDEFIRRYRNLPEDGRKLFLNVMRMLTEGAVIDTDDDGIPDGFGTVTLGELEDERKRKAAENEKGRQIRLIYRLK